MARGAVLAVARGARDDGGGPVGHRGAHVGGRVGVERERGQGDRDARAEDDERAAEERQAPAPHDERGERGDGAERQDLAADERADGARGGAVERREREAERERPLGRGVRRGRREGHPGRQAHDREHERGLAGDEAREAGHRGTPDARRLAREAGQVALPVQRGERQDRYQQGELAEQEPPVRSPDQAGDGAHLRCRAERARRGEREDAREGQAREAPRGAHGVGARVGALRAGGAPQQERERNEAAGPRAGGQRVDAVRGDRGERAGLCRRVAGGGARAERRGGEQHRLPARRAPVQPAPHVEGDGEKRGEEQEQAVADQPHVAAARLEEDPLQRDRVERGVAPSLEERGLEHQDRDARDEREHGEPPAGVEHARLPGEGRRAVGAPGEQDRAGGADEQDGER